MLKGVSGFLPCPKPYNSHTGDETSKSSYSACALPSMPHEFIETRRESMISPTFYSSVE